MVLALITNLISDPPRPDEEKLATGQTPSQYPLMIDHMAKASKGIHHHLTRTIPRMDTTKTRHCPTIRPTCHHQSIRHSKSHREESSYATMLASGEEVVTLAGETSRHDVKPVGMADPSIGNHLAMTAAHTAAAIRISITLHAAAMTKGKAPAAMTMT
jgi:replication-associated recombination protein RarA